MSAVPHSHYLGAISVAMVITSTYLTEWQDNTLPTRLLQDHNVVNSREWVPSIFSCIRITAGYYASVMHF